MIGLGVSPASPMPRLSRYRHAWASVGVRVGASVVLRIWSITRARPVGGRLPPAADGPFRTTLPRTRAGSGVRPLAVAASLQTSRNGGLGWPVGGGLHPATDEPLQRTGSGGRSVVSGTSRRTGRLSEAILGRWGEVFVSVSFGSTLLLAGRVSEATGVGRASPSHCPVYHSSASGWRRGREAHPHKPPARAAAPS